MAKRSTHRTSWHSAKRKPRSVLDHNRAFTALLVALPLAAFTAVFLSGGPPGGAASTVADADQPLSVRLADVPVPNPWPHAPPQDLTPPFETNTQSGAWPSQSPSHSTGGQRVAQRFGRCGTGARNSCIVDGDTFWHDGVKIRIADIDTPEVSSPGCAREAQLGARATTRMQQLMNEGAFTLTRPIGTPDTDKYGRKLRVLERGGASLGAALVREGLAEEWGGTRIRWCG
ncbi:hypothetical protein HME9302_00151 [Alteripontixanthobacter maritimus]|uniref:TNase-like domain-containing protein n=1 Tax=Alteripontixanthobacter maritimus TaxID=2161824 RepID=A0A369Q2I4_9SPHN|nr:thermonuclease family protein [Alteripontixanthobacter maritimus]RDC58974.1 hypothetical protein HME9302_00151 [Alteripontixanthobacter maritimus]